MRVLIITKIFPNALEPLSSPFNRQQFAALGRLCQVEVLATIPWFPLSSAFGRWSAAGRLAQVPSHDSAQRAVGVRHLPFGTALAVYRFRRRSGNALMKHPRTADQVDVVSGHWAYPDGAAAVALAEILRVPCVVKLHGSDINVVAKLPGPRRNLKWALPRARRVVAVSRALGEEVVALGVPRERVVVVQNGVDAALFHPRDRAQARAELDLPDGKWVVYVGRLEREAMSIGCSKAIARAPGLQLALVGDGSARAQVSACRDPESALAAEVMGARPARRSIPLWMAATNRGDAASWNEGGTPNVIHKRWPAGARGGHQRRRNSGSDRPVTFWVSWCRSATRPPCPTRSSVAELARCAVPLVEHAAAGTPVRGAYMTCWSKRAANASRRRRERPLSSSHPRRGCRGGAHPRHHRWPPRPGSPRRRHVAAGRGRGAQKPAAPPAARRGRAHRPGRSSRAAQKRSSRAWRWPTTPSRCRRWRRASGAGPTSSSTNATRCSVAGIAQRAAPRRRGSGGQRLVGREPHSATASSGGGPPGGALRVEPRRRHRHHHPLFPRSDRRVGSRARARVRDSQCRRRSGLRRCRRWQRGAAGVDKGVVVGYVGRHQLRRRLDLLVQAFAGGLVPASGSTFVLIGDGPDREGVAELARKLGVAERVRFTVQGARIRVRPTWRRSTSR